MVKNSRALGAWFQRRFSVALTRGSDHCCERRVLERVWGSEVVRIKLAMMVEEGGSDSVGVAETVVEAVEKGRSRDNALPFLVVVRVSI